MPINNINPFMDFVNTTCEQAKDMTTGAVIRFIVLGVFKVSFLLVGLAGVLWIIKHI